MRTRCPSCLEGSTPSWASFRALDPTPSSWTALRITRANYGWPTPTFEPNPCGLAGTVFIDATEGNQCGDVALEFNTGAGFDPTLAAGTYTVILSDADYYPAAATGSANEQLGDGFTDLTNGPAFTTCYTNSTCITDNGRWA